MQKTIGGVCPIQGKACKVTVGYIDSTTCEGTEYTKNELFCDYNKRNSCCTRNACPLYALAPQTLR